MDRKTKATKNIIEKDYNKLTKKMSQNLLYQRTVVKQQEKIMEMAVKKKDEFINRRDSAKKKLEPYLGIKEIDDNYDDIKAEYEDCLEGIDSLNKAISTCEESINEVKLGMGRV
jgi:hypothetical protein